MTRNNIKVSEAIRLVAEGELNQREIAEAIGVTRRTIERWVASRSFMEKVKAIVDEYNEKAMKKGIARRERRITVLNDLHEKSLTVIKERAEDPELQNIPGGKTGLITKMLKGIGKGEDFQVVEVYEVDTGIMKEIRAIQEQVTEELGQKVTKHEHSGPRGEPIAVRAKLEQLLAG